MNRINCFFRLVLWKSLRSLFSRLAVKSSGVSRGIRGIRGFSLIEVMVVVAIMAVIAMMSIAQIQKLVAKARQTEARQNLASLYVAEKSFLPLTILIMPDLFRLVFLRKGMYAIVLVLEKRGPSN